MSVTEDIQRLRTTYPSLATLAYDHRCSVVRDTTVNDGRGGWTETPGTIVSGLPCTFVPRSTNQREVVVSGKVVGMADGDVWIQAQVDGSALDIKALDRIVIAALGTDPQRTCEVIFPAPHQGILYQVAVRLVGA